MALWAGTTLNTTAVAQMLNQLWDMSGVAMVRKNNGLLYAVLGKTWKNDASGRKVSFTNTEKITGNKIELKLLGKLETPATVADGSAEIATATLLHDTDAWGAVEFDLTHYANTWGVPSSEFKRIKGNEAKTKSYIRDKYLEVMLAYEKVWGTAINGTDDPTRTELGGWPYMIADDNTYGLDRTDAANADFRAVVETLVGNLTLGKIKLARNEARVSGGTPRVLISETNIYSAMESLVESYAHVAYREDWSKFGGEYFSYSGMVGVLDQYAPSGTLGGLDPETFKLWIDGQEAFTDSSFITDPSRVSARVIPTDVWIGFFCNKPSANFKLTGITSVGGTGI